MAHLVVSVLAALSFALLQDADAGDKIAAAEGIAQFVVTAPPPHTPKQCVDFPTTAVDFFGNASPWLLVRSECAQLSGRDPDDGATTMITLRAPDGEAPSLVLDSQADGAEIAGQFDRLEVLTLAPSRRQVVFITISPGGSGGEVAWGLLGSVAGKVQVVSPPDLIAAATQRKLVQPGEELVFDLSLDGLTLTAASRQPPRSAAERRAWERLKAKRHRGKRAAPGRLIDL